MNPSSTIFVRGSLNSHDEIVVILVEPDNEPALVQIRWPARITTTTAAAYPAVSATIVRLIAESAVALARHKAGL